MNNIANESFNEMYKKAKILAKDGDLENCLSLLFKCQERFPSDKINAQIEKVKSAISSSSSDQSPSFPSQLQIPNEIESFLYDYQSQGIQWLWNLWTLEKGGILADEMGLGKTVQIIALIRGIEELFKTENYAPPTSLIITPLSVINVWTSEFKKWSPKSRFQVYQGSPRDREHCFARTKSRGGSILITFNLLTRSTDIVRNHKWDLVVVDEGHKLRNQQTLTAKSVKALDARSKMILTGTAIQNNLEELWSLINIVGPKDGRLLGNRQAFRNDYEYAIRNGRSKDAGPTLRIIGQSASERLRRIVEPYILRRTRNSVLGKNGAVVKYDIIVWCHLSERQKQLYLGFLTLDEVRQFLDYSKSPLVALSVLKAICDHPRIRGFANWTGGVGTKIEEETVELPDRNVLLEESGKLMIAVNLIQRLISEQHKTLVFSRSLRMLNIIEKVLAEIGIHVLRLDGNVKLAKERDRITNRWQQNSETVGEPMVMLLTTQVGGVGITLTAADRVIIYDPSWNPANDDQAVDRACRIGQSKPVVIYRLVTCGTIEEKIYRRQIFKRALFETVMNGEKDPVRYFSRQELKEVFMVRTIEKSTTREYVIEIHGDIAQDGDQYIRNECQILAQNSGVHFHGVSDNKVINKVAETDNPAAVDEEPKDEVRSVNTQCVPIFKAPSQQLDFVDYRKTQSSSSEISSASNAAIVHATTLTSDSGRFHTPTSSLSTLNEHSERAGGIACSTPDKLNGLNPSRPMIPACPDLSKINESGDAAEIAIQNIMKRLSELVVDDNQVDDERAKN